MQYLLDFVHFIGAIGLMVCIFKIWVRAEWGKLRLYKWVNLTIFFSSWQSLVYFAWHFESGMPLWFSAVMMLASIVGSIWLLCNIDDTGGYEDDTYESIVAAISNLGVASVMAIAIIIAYFFSENG